MSTDQSAGERFSTVQPFDHRRLDRRGCDLAASVVTGHGEWRARIIDISSGGLGFTIDPMLGLKPGQGFLMRQDMLGEIRCIVRWTLHPRYGATFEPEGRTPPGARTVYDSLNPGQARSG